MSEVIPAPPIFNADLLKRPLLQKGVVRNDNKVDNRISYLLSFIRKPQDSHFVVCLHDSESVVQEGPTCGLVAISMASKLIKGVIVQQASPDELLRKAKQLNYSRNGEMFSAENLLKLSLEQLQCPGKLLTFDNIQKVVSLILKGNVLLFPYDADKDHSPCQLKGHKAHWALSVGCAMLVSDQEVKSILPVCNSKELEGYHTVDNTKLTPEAIGNITEFLTLKNTWLFCRQGKSRYLCLWSLNDIVESNGNLFEMLPHCNSNLIVPTGGLQSGLCGKVVLLEKEFK